MKKKIDKLSLLINQMSKSEKRHFTLLANTFNKSDKSYLQLFHILDKNSNISDREISNSLAVYDIHASIPTLKNYLYAKLLYSIVSFHQQQNEEQQLFQSLSEIYHLKEKSLYMEALKKINKLRKDEQL